MTFISVDIDDKIDEMRMMLPDNIPDDYITETVEYEAKYQYGDEISCNWRRITEEEYYDVNWRTII